MNRAGDQEERRIDVNWGADPAVVVLHRIHDRWEGVFGQVKVVEYRTKNGTPFAQASIKLPDVLDPYDGYEHRLSGDYQDDVPRAVMALHSKLAEVLAWTTAAMNRTGNQKGARTCDSVTRTVSCQPGPKPRLSWPTDVNGYLGSDWCPRCCRIQGHPCDHPERRERDEALRRRDAKWRTE